ncbi:MAG: sulfur oxidation c-type cytochrome SoxX [Hyphomicrobiaceae bacterium]
MRPRNKIGGLALVAAFGIGIAMVPGLAAAETVTPSDVKINDGELAKSLSGKPGDATAGKNWFVGRKLGNCLACHVNKDTSKQQFHGEVGPPMDGVAERYSEAQLRAIIVNSKAVFGDQTLMPAFYRTAGFNRVNKKFKNKTILTAQQVEDVVAYLRTLKE